MYDILTNLCLIKSRLNVLHIITASLGPKLILMKNHYHTSIPHSYSFIVVKKDMQFKIAWCGMILRYDTQSQRFFLLFNLEPRHSYIVLEMQAKYHIGIKWNNQKHVVVDLNGRRKWQPSDNDYISEGKIYVCKCGSWISLTIFDTTLKLTIKIIQKTPLTLSSAEYCEIVKNVVWVHTIKVFWSHLQLQILWWDCRYLCTRDSDD